MNSSNQYDSKKKISPVFIYSAIIVAIVVILGAVFPAKFGEVTDTIKLWITDKLG